MRSPFRAHRGSPAPLGDRHLILYPSLSPDTGPPLRLALFHILFDKPTSLLRSIVWDLSLLAVSIKMQTDNRRSEAWGMSDVEIPYRQQQTSGDASVEEDNLWGGNGKDC